jgi:SNF2 family DNA or RNA helicase
MKYTNLIKDYKLFPYSHQINAVEFLMPALLNFGYAGLLMDMGSGKSKTSLSLFQILKIMGKTDFLILIAPKRILTFSWPGELEDHMNEKYYSVFWESTKTGSKKYVRSLEYLYKTTLLPIFMVNIEAFQTQNDRFLRFFKNLTINRRCTIILDESSTIKNNKAKRTKRIIQHSGDAAYKMILTGTEISTSYLDLYTQFEFLKNNFWNYKQFYYFKLRYAILEKKYRSRTETYEKVVGFQHINELKEKIKHCTFRIKKEDCLDLPEKILKDVVLEMNKDQRKFYDELKEKMMAQYETEVLTVQNKLVLTTRFRQIAAGFTPEEHLLLGSENVKAEFIIEDTEEYTGKVAIFTAFKAEAIYLKKHIQEKTGFNCAGFYGDNKDANKELKNFETQDSWKYAVISMAMGSLGLNLQFCSLCYYYSRVDSPEKNWQSYDRFHRPGQKNHPIYKHLLFRNSVEMGQAQRLKNYTQLKDIFQGQTTEDFFNLL